MKNIIAIIFSFLSLHIWGQNTPSKNKPAIPAITFLNNADTLNALDKNDNGLRVLKIPVLVKNKPKEINRQTIRIRLLDLNNILSRPVLIDSDIVITGYQPSPPNDSNTYRSFAICNIQLAKIDSTVYESFYIIKENDLSANFKVVIAPVTSATNGTKPLVVAAKPVDASSTTKVIIPSTKTGNHIHLDNLQTDVNPNYNDQYPPSMANIRIVLMRDTLPSPSGIDTVNFKLDNFNFPPPLSLKDSFQILLPISPFYMHGNK